MNFKENESAQKLEGAYYTPPKIADFISRWICEKYPLTILEPSCGEGVFVKSVASYLCPENVSITICDKDSDALYQATEIAREIGYKDIRHIEGDYVSWSIGELLQQKHKTYDAVIGNPPFVRYQYLENEIKEAAQSLYVLLEKSFTKHTNLWVAFLMSSFELLNPGGRIGFVIPEEIVSVLYAREARQTLEQNCTKVVLVTSQDRKFEETLQGFVVLLAEKKEKQSEQTAEIAIFDAENDIWEDDPRGIFDKCKGLTSSGKGNKWTKMLLSEQEATLFDDFQRNQDIYTFTDLANVEVGIVTGANNYFLVNDQVVKEYGLEEAIKPMFGRSGYCPGVIFDKEQYELNKEKGLPTNFVHLTEENSKKFEKYIQYGERIGINNRYKCRIRNPWYTVPGLSATEIAMPKRSSDMPRLIFNELGAYTTDTAYRVSPLEHVKSPILVSYFQNSITALSAELEGRFYGGGVLELVPSEIRKLIVPYKNEELTTIEQLNKETKNLCSNDLLEVQDNRLATKLGISKADLEVIRNAWKKLSKRRQSIKS